MELRNIIISKLEAKNEERERELFQLKKQHLTILDKYELSQAENERLKDQIKSVDNVKDQYLAQIDNEEEMRSKLQGYILLKKRKINTLLGKVKELKLVNREKEGTADALKKTFFDEMKKFDKDLKLVIEENTSLYKQLQERDDIIKEQERVKLMYQEEVHNSKVLRENLKKMNDINKEYERNLTEYDFNQNKLIHELNVKRNEVHELSRNFESFHGEVLNQTQALEIVQNENDNLLKANNNFDEIHKGISKKNKMLLVQLKDEKILRTNLIKENMDLKKRNIVVSSLCEKMEREILGLRELVLRKDEKVKNLSLLLRNIREDNFTMSRRMNVMDAPNQNEYLVVKLKNEIKKLKNRIKGMVDRDRDIVTGNTI